MSFCRPHQCWVFVKSIFRLLIGLLHRKECDARSVPLLPFFHRQWPAIQQVEHGLWSDEIRMAPDPKSFVVAVYPNTVSAGAVSSVCVSQGALGQTGFGQPRKVILQIHVRFVKGGHAFRHA